MGLRKRGNARIYTPETLSKKCAEVQRLLASALEAENDPEVLDAVAKLAFNHPEIEWEPVFLSSAALNAKRDMDEAKARASNPLNEKVKLPEAPRSGGGGVGGIPLSLAAQFFG